MLIPCDKCVRDERHCGWCSCCGRSLLPNPWILGGLAVSVGLLWVAYELFCGVIHLVQRVGR